MIKNFITSLYQINLKIISFYNYYLFKLYYFLIKDFFGTNNNITVENVEQPLLIQIFLEGLFFSFILLFTFIFIIKYKIVLKLKDSQIIFKNIYDYDRLNFKNSLNQKKKYYQKLLFNLLIIILLYFLSLLLYFIIFPFKKDNIASIT